MRIYILFIFLLVSFGLLAQKASFSAAPVELPPKQYTLIGELRELGTNQPIPFATIEVVKSADNKVVNGGLTNEQGKFKIEGITTGVYDIKAHFVGFKSAQVSAVDISGNKSIISLKSISLEPSAAALETTTITAEQNFVVNAIDRKVYNVAKNLATDGGTISEILSNLPSVDVDIDGNVSLRGSNNVNILIDGKPSSISGGSVAEILQQLPANSVERVEIITNPSAKYDPDGMSGMINIVLKKNRRAGFNGSVGLGLGNWVPEYPESKYNGNLSLAYRNKKINVYGSAGINSRPRWRSGETYAYTDNSTMDTLNYLDRTQINTSTRNGVSYNFKTGVDYSFNKRNTISGSVAHMNRTRNGRELIVFTDEYGYLNESYVNAYARGNETNGGGVNNDMNLNFTHKMEKQGEEIQLDYTLSTSTGFRGGSYYTVDPTISLSDNFGPFHNGNMKDNVADTARIHTIALDYIYPLDNGGKLETGLKTILRQLNNEYFGAFYDSIAQAFTPNTALNNQFVYDEALYAGYVTYGQEIGGFGFQAGARLEQAYTGSTLINTSEYFPNNYLSLFPSAHISKKLDHQQELRVSYSRRINRPRSRQLNPFSDRSDPTFIRTGNPFLKPEYVNAYELSYAKYWDNHSITTSVYHRAIQDVIRRYVVQNEEGQGELTYINLDNGSNSGIELVAMSKPTDWWSLNLSGNWFFSFIDGSGVDESIQPGGFSWTSKLNNSIKAWKGGDLQVTGRYRGRRIVTLGELKAMYNIDFAIRQQLFNKKGSLSLNISDIFNTRAFAFDIDGITDSGNGVFSRNGIRNFESRVARLNFTYRFGKMDKSKSRRRSGGESSGGGGDIGF